MDEWVFGQGRILGVGVRELGGIYESLGDSFGLCCSEG